jgi:hypothetical protein
MATVAITSSSVQLDSGTAYELLVVNTGSIDVYVARGQQTNKLRPGAKAQVQPEGAAVTAYVAGATAGQVLTTVTAASNPQIVGIDGGTP